MQSQRVSSSPAVVGSVLRPRGIDPSFESRRFETRIFRTEYQGEVGIFGGFRNDRAPSVPQPVPTAALGTVVFDGNGGCVVTTTINVNGTTLVARARVSPSSQEHPLMGLPRSHL